ncbi:MAG: TolC family protein [Verrucomicrobiae bacterium]|nr:TolC family protein [Verrucomicrobiae bacterium]
MRRFPPILLLSAILAGGVLGEETPAAVPPLPGPLDLATCYELAVLRSETLGMREEDVRVAEARYWQALGGILPQVHSVTTEDLQNAGGSQGAGGATRSGGYGKDRFSTRLRVSQPLFQGFREFNAAAAARADAESQRQIARRFRQTLYRDVAEVFYQTLTYEGDLRILGDVEDALEERIGELEKRVQLGKSRSSELLTAQTDLANARVLSEQARGLLGATRELLAFFTGLKAEVLALKDTQKMPAAEALEAWLVRTGERADIMAAIAAERSAARQLSAAKGELWPSISVSGNYYLNQHPDSPLNWDVTLTCDLPLFDGGILAAKVRAQKARLRSSTLSLSQVRRDAERETRTAYNNFVSASARWLRLDETCRISTQAWETQKRDYHLGVSSNLDVLNALRQMHEARRQRHDAEMEMRADLVALHVAAGDPSSAPAKP